MSAHHKMQLYVFLAIAILVFLSYILFGQNVLRISQMDWVGDLTGIQHPHASTTALYDFIATVPQQFISTDCDSSLWQHNAEAEKISAPCIYITGVVERVKPEDDGDMNIQLKLDSQYSTLLNSYNIKDGAGNIGIEPICVVIPSRSAFKESCKGYSSHVTIPEVGMHIGVKGSYGQDKHYWMEIHPVSSINVL